MYNLNYFVVNILPIVGIIGGSFVWIVKIFNGKIAKLDDKVGKLETCFSQLCSRISKIEELLEGYFANSHNRKVQN
jgi:hypothetical protein